MCDLKNKVLFDTVDFGGCLLLLETSRLASVKFRAKEDVRISLFGYVST